MHHSVIPRRFAAITHSILSPIACMRAAHLLEGNLVVLVQRETARGSTAVRIGRAALCSDASVKTPSSLYCAVVTELRPSAISETNKAFIADVNKELEEKMKNA